MFGKLVGMLIGLLQALCGDDNVGVDGMEDNGMDVIWYFSCFLVKKLGRAVQEIYLNI
jgi:hypothetical protein